MKQLCIISFPTVLILLSPTAQAQWSTDPSNNLIVGYGLLPELCRDGEGGCYITYEQNLVYPRNIILERLNRYGYKPWVTGKQITGLFSEQSSAKIVEDGQDGVIVAYLDEYQGGMISTTRMRVQRIDSTGNFLWGANGVRVSLSETNQYNQEIVSDGQTGCFVAWYDTLNELRLQRIDRLGNRMLGDSGIYVDASNTNMVWLTSDNRYGCFSYVSDANGARIHHIDFTGTKLWSTGGVYVDGWGWPKMAPDGYGGLILAGMKFISYNNGDPYYAATCQRIDSSGTILWGTSGLTIDDSIQYESLQSSKIDVVVLRDIAILEWGKRIGQDTLNIFTQGVHFDQSLLFTKNVNVSAGSSQRKIGGQWLVASDSLKTIHLWMDSRTPSGCYAQIIDSSGQRTCGGDDIAVSLPSFTDMDAASDGNGGMILVGFHQFDFSIRAQQVSKNGNLGEVVLGVNDFRGQRANSFALYQNFPNPFNSSTTIFYSTNITQRISIKIYDILGHEVKTVFDGIRDQGQYVDTFDGELGPSGTYFIVMRAQRFQNQIRKIVHIK